MKHFYFFILCIVAANLTVAQTVLNPGEVLIVGYYGDSSVDGVGGCGNSFAFLNYVPLAPNTVIRFSEEDFNEWASNPGEGELVWTNNTGSTIPALTRINIVASNQDLPCGSSGPVAAIGTAVYENFFPTSIWTLNDSNEEIIVYQSPTARDLTPGVGLAISLFLTDTSTQDNNTPTTLRGTNFITNFDKIDDDVDVAIYRGPTTFTDFNDFVAQVTNNAVGGNWATQNTSGDNGKDGIFPDYPVDLLSFAGNIILSTSSFEAVNVSVYPNPVTDMLHLNTKDALSNVEIFNSLGQKIFEKSSFVNEKKQIDMSQFQTGIYFLKASVGRNAQTFKIIKQ